MKEQWRTDKDAATVEEGLQQEKQEYVSKLKYNTNCCKQWIRYIRLIFLFELLLFFGWGCYMILQSYHFRVTENGVTDINNEKYSPVFKSVSEAQKSLPTTETPVIFIEPEAITDKLNNFLRAIKIRNAKEHGKTIVIDLDSIMQTSTQNSISISNNIVKTNDHSAINHSPMTSSEDLVYDDGFMKNLIPSKISSREYFDKIVTTNKNENPNNYYNSDFYKFVEKLSNIAKLIIVSELKEFEKEDLNKDVNQFTLNNQEDRVLDTSNKVESLGPDVTTILKLKDSDFKINFESSEQDPEQRFSNLFEDAADDHGEKSSSRDETGEEINASESDFVICPPYQSYESSGIFSEDAIKSSSTSQSVSAPEILGQIKNVLSDYSIKNNDKQDADDNNTPTSTSSDVSVSESDEHFAFDTWKPIIVQNRQGYDLSKINNYGKEEEEITIKEKEENDEEEKWKNIDPFVAVLQKIQDTDVESSTSNVAFQWFNAPPLFANDLPLGPKDISESMYTPNPSLEDTTEATTENTEAINVFISENDKSHNQCRIEVKMNVITIKCPDMLDAEWNLASSQPNTHDADFSPVNFKDNFDFYMYDYNDDYVNELHHRVPTVINTDELQESIPDVKSLKDASDYIFVNSFDKTELDKHDIIDSAKKEEISLVQQQKQLKSAENYDDDYVSELLNEFIAEKNSDKKFASLQHRVPTVINTDELQESIPDVKSLKDALGFIFVINPFDKTEVDKHDIIDSSEKEKIFSMQQEKQLKSAEDFLNSDNTETFLENKERVYALEKQLTSIFNDEMLNIIKQSLPESSEDDYSDYICSISTYICPSFPNSSRQQYVDLKRFLDYMRNHDNPYDIKDDYNNRKKRTVDDLAILEQYEPVSNTLEEVDKNLSRNLKRVFQKMEILAACIDRLHERILNNKMDDDYVSKEFSMETEERQELNKKIDI